MITKEQCKPGAIVYWNVKGPYGSPGAWRDLYKIVRARSMAVSVEVYKVGEPGSKVGQPGSAPMHLFDLYYQSLDERINAL